MATKKKTVGRRPTRPKATPKTRTRRASTPRLTVITLGVQDLARSRAFYGEGLGFPVTGSSNESIVFMDAGGVVLALYRRKLLADDANILTEGSGFGGVTLARNVRSSAEVDAALDAAKAAGARILRPAHKTFWGGYSGYFADPDGHPWEVAHNPHWKLDADGRVVLPK
jgi:catechol 2,3-dioxygenase-like lactoylglutathione lyase family enzyme